MERIRRIAMVICALCSICVCVAAQPQLSVAATDRAIVGQILPMEIEIPAQEHSVVECILSFDDQQIQFHSLPEAQGWDMDYLGKTFTMTRKEDASAELRLKMKLQILPVPVHTRICISFRFTGEGNVTLGEAAHEITVGKPLSYENFLTELSVEGGILSPQFHPDVLKYTATVPNHCQQPQIYAVGAEKSQVDVIPKPFDEDGVSVVTVVVTAENGNRREYTLQVLRDIQEETVPETTVDTQPETNSTELSSPTQRPTQSIQPTRSTEPVQSMKPTKPTEATHITQPTLPTQATKPAQKPSDEGPMDLKDQGVPGWVFVAGILAGASLGGAGVVLLIQKQGKNH